MAAMGKYEHFVITPYFVRFNENTNDRDARLRASPDWLENRLQLFKDFCLPSVMAQSDKSFRWFLYFDENVPSEYMERIRGLISPYSNIEIKICTLFNRELLENSVKAALASDTKWVLTTRLDNDDGWHRDFVKVLHSQLSFERREFLNFPVGLIYYAGNTYLYRHESNAFISFLEPSDDFLTAWCGPHPYLSRVAPIRQLTSFAAFLQVVHGQTRSNKPRGVRIHRMLALNGFEAIRPLFSAVDGETDFRIIMDNVTSAAMWAARDRAVALTRKAARQIVKSGLGGAKITKMAKRLTGD